MLSLAGTAATTVAWFVEARRSRLDALTSWSFLTPVVGIVLAVGVLGERPTGWAALGLAATLVAMWVALRSPRIASIGAGGLADTQDLRRTREEDGAVGTETKAG